MNFTTKAINDISIKPVIDNSKRSPKLITGYDYFPEPYCNVAMYARKASGKSTVIYRALEKCAVKGTNIMIFASTVNNDATYKKMIAMLVRKGCNVKTFTHFCGDDKVDHIKNFLDVLSEESEETVKPRARKPTDAGNGNPDMPIIPRAFADFGQYDEVLEPVIEAPKKAKAKPKKKKPSKPKMITPETIIVIDDLSTACRSPTISKLLTKNRHYKLKIFIACHSITNLDPQGVRMIDYHLVFPNISEEKIEELADKVGISFKSDTKKHKKLWDLYQDATRDKYNFLYIDRIKCEYRKNFDSVFQIDD